MTIFFSGDTHFGQERTRLLSKRPFKDVDEMDSTIVDNWNSVVKPDDIVFHVGDFGNYSVRAYLNGKINLLLGNYEREDIAEGALSIRELKELYGFNDVYAETRVNLYELDIDIVHEPSNRNPHNFTLFGHIYSAQKIKKDALNVGVDCHHFHPVSLSDVLFYKDAIDQHYDFEVFME